MRAERELRRKRIRKSGSRRRKLLRRTDRPRLAVFRSNKYIYAQVIDDAQGKTLASASSRDGGLASPEEGMSGKVGAAFSVGQELARRAKEAGIEKVVFDRRYYKYHGRVKALADGARKGGLDF